MKYETELISKRLVAEGTMEFTFRKPDGFSFEAGQSIDLTLVDPPETDAEGNTRSFSVASAPSAGHIAVATRMRDTAFKRVLGSLEPGAKALIEGPFGSFRLHDDATRPAVFLTGGIGITPFVSIVRDATERGLPHDMHLFYSNKTMAGAAYADELSAFASENQAFRFIPTLTRERDDRQGEHGRISAEMVAKHIKAERKHIYYIAGPLGMVASLERMLRDRGVSRDDIRTEEFPGY